MDGDVGSGAGHVGEPVLRRELCDRDRFGSLIGDLEEWVFGRLPDKTWVYPGHGDDTTLGSERPSIPEWRARGW